MIHKAHMPVYMNSGKIVADGWRIEGSTRGPRGPKKTLRKYWENFFRNYAPFSIQGGGGHNYGNDCKQYFNLYVVLTNHSAHITIRAELACNVKCGNCDICFHHNWH